MKNLNEDCMICIVSFLNFDDLLSLDISCSKSKGNIQNIVHFQYNLRVNRRNEILKNVSKFFMLNKETDDFKYPYVTTKLFVRTLTIKHLNNIPNGNFPRTTTKFLLSTKFSSIGISRIYFKTLKKTDQSSLTKLFTIIPATRFLEFLSHDAARRIKYQNQ